MSSVLSVALCGLRKHQTRALAPLGLGGEEIAFPASSIPDVDPFASGVDIETPVPHETDKSHSRALGKFDR